MNYSTKEMKRNKTNSTVLSVSRKPKIVNVKLKKQYQATSLNFANANYFEIDYNLYKAYIFNRTKQYFTNVLRQDLIFLLQKI